nr:ABC transporter G family member 11 [Ipomoea batatas]
MASLMATSQKLNLAIPVLASIYNGLNAISNSAKPGQADSHFPIHYVYGWLSFYYDTHFANDQVSASPQMITYSGEGGARRYGQVEARRKIFKADSVRWGCTTRRQTKDLRFLDDGKENHSQDDEYYDRPIHVLQNLTLPIDLADSLATIKTVALAYWAMMNVGSLLRRVSTVGVTLHFGARGHK